MNTTFKRMISMALICMMMIGTLAGFSVSADEAVPTIEFVSNNISYGETLKLMYAVKTENAPEGATIRVTITDEGKNVYNTVAAGPATKEGVVIGEAFKSEHGVPAQNIDAQFTATAELLNAEGEVIATTSSTYSVLQYLWHRLNVSTDATAEQKAMYNALIEYAKAADVVLNNEAVSSIANLTYVVINGEGAMYNVGDEVELITDLVAGEGQEIVWTLNGETYTEATYVVTNAFANFVATVAGDVVEPEEPTPEEPEWTVADALEAEDGTVITLTATVESIYQAYNSSYNNISVYLTDDSGARMIAFRLTGNVHIGDLITVTGTITTYEATGVKQFAQGCTFEMVEAHNCEEYLNEATCETPATCASCEQIIGEALGHADEDSDGVCDRCSTNLTVATTTVTVLIKDYAAANGWSNSIMYNTLVMDENITVTANKTTGNSNTGKYYTSGNNWRMYQNENPAIVITAAEGKTIVSVKITYTSEKTGAITLDGEIVASNEVVMVNGDSITFSVGNTGTAANGQARITAIEVVYQ